MKFVFILANLILLYFGVSSAHGESLVSSCVPKSTLTTQTFSVLQIQCMQRMQTFRCAQEKAKGTFEKDAFTDCEDHDDVMTPTSLGSKLFSCGKGAGGVAIDNLIGIIYVPKMVYDLATGVASLPSPFSGCYENLDYKRVILGALKPAEMTSATVASMSCHEVQKFVRTKVEVIVQKLEARRQSEMAVSGRENLRYNEMELSEAEKQALSYDKSRFGLPGFECLKPKEAAKLICEKLTNTAFAAAGLAATPALAAKAASRLGVGPKQVPKVTPSNEPAFKKVTSAESNIHGIQDPHLKAFIDDRPDLVAEIEKSPNAKQFLKSAPSKFDPGVPENWERWLKEHPPNKADEHELSVHRGIGYDKNEFMRGNLELKPEYVREWNKNIKSVERALLNRPSYDGIVFRRTDMPTAARAEYLKPGNVVSDKGFMSTTYDGAIKKVESSRAFWQNADKNQNGIFLFIKSKTGRLADEPGWNYYNEAEVIFLPRTHFRVNEVIYRDGIPHVFMSEI